MRLDMLHQKISLIQSSMLDSEARIYLHSQDPNVKEISGQLYGPHCEFAKTLRSTFTVRPVQKTNEENALSEIFFTDPCFWTTKLPFLYELKLQTTTHAGETQEHTATLGFKQWYTDGTSWNLQGKRFVLRGAQSLGDAPSELPQAREAETSLIVPPPNETTLRSADLNGTSLIIDLRNDHGNYHDQISRFSWSPAIMAVIVSPEQLTLKANPPSTHSTSIPVGLAVNAQTTQAEHLENPTFDFYAVQLNTDEHPPTWLLEADKPVIAIRNGVDYADFSAARTACDRLQAELAPKFDLAGYFVTP